MDSLLSKIQKEYAFSDFQIKLIRYSILVIFYDLSKLLLFAVYFYIIGKIIHFLFAAIPLFILRTRNGGIHFKKYWQCFAFSFIYLFSAINILPTFFPVPLLTIYLVLILCAMLNYFIGPNVSAKKKKPDITFIRKAKWETFHLMLIVAILFFFFSRNDYLMISFWTIVLHTLQLTMVQIKNNLNSNTQGGDST